MGLAEVIAAYDMHLLLFVFIALGLLGAGFFTEGRRSHWLRLSGWVLFALYWPTQTPHFLEIGDPVNAGFTLIGPLFLLYVAYHEHLSLRWDEDPRALRWLAGASFIAAGAYFVIYKIPAVTDLLITQTSSETAWMLSTLFGVPATAATGANGGDVFINGSDYAVTVILACTAIQSIMIFVGAIYTTTAEPRRKALAYLYTVPVIYVLNIFRNAGIVYGYKVLHWSMFGISSFEWMHSYVGKIGSLVALVVIAIAVFDTLPELHRNILDILDLPRRRSPGFYDGPPPPPGSGSHAAGAAEPEARG